MNSQGNIDDCLELMQKLIEYRYQKALHHKLMKAADHSMLGIDVLVLIYHFAKVAKGDILEIGSFVGGSPSQRVWVRAIREAGRKSSASNRAAGSGITGWRPGTFSKTSKGTLSRAGLLDAATLINGSSFEEKTITAVREMTGPDEVGLFIFDADSNVRRDIDCYGERLAQGCWMVIDDYISATDKGGARLESK